MILDHVAGWEAYYLHDLEAHVFGLDLHGTDPANRIMTARIGSSYDTDPAQHPMPTSKGTI